MIAWADNWQYRDYMPTSPFKGQMSCVRELKLKKKGTRYLLVQQPVEEMQSLRKNEREMRNIKMGAGEEWTICNQADVLELLISYPTEFRQAWENNSRLHFVKMNVSAMWIE